MAIKSESIQLGETTIHTNGSKPPRLDLTDITVWTEENSVAIAQLISTCLLKPIDVNCPEDMERFNLVFHRFLEMYISTSHPEKNTNQFLNALFINWYETYRIRGIFFSDPST